MEMRAVFFSCSFWFLAATNAVAQNIYVHTNDGATHTYPLIDVNSITFTAYVMNLNLVSADTVSWNISSVNFYEYDQWYVSVPDGLMLDKTGITVYPNPSAATVNISYNLTDGGDVQVSVFDMKGSLVKDLYRGHQGGGKHILSWQPDNSLAGGVYLCKVMIGKALFNKLIMLDR